MDNLDKYLQNYQDMFIERQLDLSRYPSNMIKEEFNLIEKHLDELLVLTDSQTKLTQEGAIQFKKTYENLITSLENKIKYIQDSSVVFNKLNVTYDKNSIVAYENIKLQDENIPEILYYNDAKKGYTLPRTSVTTNCPYVVEGDTLTVTNSNLNIHNSISISNDYFNYIENLDIVILKIDGTVVNKRVAIVDYFKHNIIIDHETAASLQINIKLEYKDEELSALLKTTVLNNFKVSLNLSNYSNFATQTFKRISLDYAKYLIINETLKVPSGCYCNYNITINNEVTFTTPIGNSVVCKRLDLINKKEIKKIVGMYIKNIYVEEALDIEYVLSLPFPTEKYIVYIPKVTDNTIINNKIKMIQNNSFSILNSASKIDLDLQLELYSFNSTETPLLKSIVGFTKNE